MLSAYADRSSFPTDAARTRSADQLTVCNVLVVGNAHDALPYLRGAYASSRRLKFVGFLPVNGVSHNGMLDTGGDDRSDVSVQVERILDQTVVDEVLVATEVSSIQIDRIALTCAERGLGFRTLIKAPLPNIGRCRVAPLGASAYLLSIDTVPQGRWQLRIKRLMDLIGAFAGLILCSVVYLWCGTRVKRQSRGSVIFQQRRIGRNGRGFIVFKFRTMYADAEARLAELLARNQMHGCMFKMADDPRITPVGKILRRRHLDELPQFWNVLRGEMSLVGTRPPTPEEFASYQGHHRRRLSMKPGITGLWQIHGNHQVNDFEEIVKLDCRYIDTWSLWLDCKILFRTVAKVWRATGW
jgi:exopolysaccharide biosynthesis polyprenyl glycosylphosphotransferase